MIIIKNGTYHWYRLVAYATSRHCRHQWCCQFVPKPSEQASVRFESKYEDFDLRNAIEYVVCNMCQKHSLIYRIIPMGDYNNNASDSCRNWADASSVSPTVTQFRPNITLWRATLRTYINIPL